MSLTLQPGITLQQGRYKIIDVLGQGGFGITYLAEHTMLHTKIAIKEFFFKGYSSRSTGDESTMLLSTSNPEANETVQKFKRKFIKEAQLISTLSHPNIVRVQDVFEENDTAYYVMDYIEGQTLEQVVQQNGKIAEETALDYIKAVADALGYLHQRSVNHLDVKPANIMLRREDGKLLLIDFGTSKQYDDAGSQTSTTPVGISHGYAPMEQYTPGGVAQFSPQVDVYSLGATLYRLVTGLVPPQAVDVISEGLPSFPAGVSLPTCKAIREAMQPKKSNRPSSVEAFVDMLPKKKKDATKTQMTSTDTPKPKTWKYVMIGIAALVLLLILVKGCGNSGNTATPVNVEKPAGAKADKQNGEQPKATPQNNQQTKPQQQAGKQPAAPEDNNAESLRRAKAAGDYGAIKKLADDGYAPACVPLAEHYLEQAKAGDASKYDLADKYAQKARRQGVSGANKIIETLRSLGYYD